MGKPEHDAQGLKSNFKNDWYGTAKGVPYTEVFAPLIADLFLLLQIGHERSPGAMAYFTL